MNLKDFVADTLKQIIDGVAEAQAHGKEKGASINPLQLPIRNEKGEVHQRPYRADVAHPIDFDVAVTTNDGRQTSAGVGVITARTFLL